MKILAIETSCDETAAAVVEDGVKIISNVVATSAEVHKKYGGVVPEIAAREQLHYILPVLKESLSPFSKDQNIGYRNVVENHIDAVAVTVGPGLIGSLLIGVETAKTICFITKKPIIPVNHVLAHMYANFVEHEQQMDTQFPKSNNQFMKEISFPVISLVVSGGHTELYLMKSVKELQWLGGTLDDAAGEAFDKTARLLGFENRGGIAIQDAAQLFHQHPTTYNFKLPRPMMHEDNLHFSFSGLKTAIVREWGKYESHNADLIQAFAHEVQESITDVLVAKTLKAVHEYKAKSILLSGGVAANIRLRNKFMTAIETLNAKVTFHVPPIPLCTDNAVYIASYAFFRGKKTHWKKIEAMPDMDIESKE